MYNKSMNKGKICTIKDMDRYEHTQIFIDIWRPRGKCRTGGRWTVTDWVWHLVGEKLVPDDDGLSWIKDMMVVKRLDWSEQHLVVGEKPTLRRYEQGKIVNVLEEENRIFYNFSLGIREGL